MAQQLDLHPNQIIQRRLQLLKGAAGVFGLETSAAAASVIDLINSPPICTTDDESNIELLIETFASDARQRPTGMPSAMSLLCDQFPDKSDELRPAFQHVIRHERGLEITR